MSQPVFLRIFSGDRLQQVKQSLNDQIVIGRGSDVTIDLDGDSVSPIHAIIEKRDGGYYVCDLGSATGTKKNGQNILDVHLDSGDIIEVGAFQLEFYIGIPKPRAKPPKVAELNTSKASESSKQVEDLGMLDEESLRPEAPSLAKLDDDLVYDELGLPDIGSAASEEFGEQESNIGDVFDQGEVPVESGRASGEATSAIGGQSPQNEGEAKIFQVEAPEVIPARRNADQTPIRKDVFVGSGKTSAVSTTSHSEGATSSGTTHKQARRKHKKWGKSFAPGNLVGDMRTYIRPSKGTIVEVLVVWQDRVLSSYHFNEKGTILAGTEQGVHILLPTLQGPRSSIPLVVIESQAVVLVPTDVRITLARQHGFVSMENLEGQSRLPSGQGPFRILRLDQGEMAIMEFGYGLFAYIRYVPEAPRPLLGPLLDMTATERMGLILGAVVGTVLALFLIIHTPTLEEEQKPAEEEIRKAVFVYNRPESAQLPPLPVPTPIPTPVPTPKPMPTPAPQKIVKVNVSDKSPTTKSVQKAIQKPISKPTNAPSPKKSRGTEGKTGGLAKAPNPVRRSGLSTTKSGGSVKIGSQAGANAKSDKVDVNNVGLLSTFGNSGVRSSLDKAYSGSGTTLGLANQATGAAGQNSDRPGEDIGSSLKATSGGTGKGTIGIAGVKTAGRGGGVQGYGMDGLGGREKVSIIQGGEEEEFTGTIDREAVRRVVRQHLRELRACYERGLNKDESLSGKVVLEWEFGARGRVLAVKVVTSSLGNRSVEGCLMQRLRGWQFPETPPNQIGVVKYPFVFNSK